MSDFYAFSCCVINSIKFNAQYDIQLKKCNLVGDVLSQENAD